MKNSKEIIICHSFPSWDAPYVKSTIEILKPLASTYRIVFVDYAYTWKDLLFKSYLPKARILGFKSRKRIIEQADGGQIEVISLPPILPSLPFFKKMIARFNTALLKSFLKKLVQKESLSESTYINSLNPKWGLEFASLFEPKTSIYYCYDNIDSMSWASDRLAKYERPFTKMVDKVICSSKGLQEKLMKYNSNTYVINNGFDSNRFQPEKLITGDQHIISYLGAIDNRLDYALIEKMLLKYPNYRFQFIGPIRSKEITMLDEAYSNLELTGAVLQEQVAELLKNSSACIIPFLKTDFTKYIYPLKINEYLALGKSVVSTDFSIDVASFDECIERCSDHHQFLHSICLAANSNKHLDIAGRIEFVANNSWDHRANEFSQQLA